MSTIGERIRARRESLGLTQGQLADRLGISNSSVAHTEADRTDISMKRLKQYAEALNCRTEDLLSDVGMIEMAQVMNAKIIEKKLSQDGYGSDCPHFQNAMTSHCDNPPASEKLTPNERLIIERYRMLGETDKMSLLGQILAYTEKAMNNQEGGEL